MDSLEQTLSIVPLSGGKKKKECECQLEVVGRMRRRVCNRGVGRGGHFLSNIVKLLEKLAAF